MESWSAYYARSSDLPKPEITARFLTTLPTNATILDFGCGSGRWALAFARDRPDLTIDLVDLHLDEAVLIPTVWKGTRYVTSFENFTPERTYDGIWSFASLFFLKRVHIQPVLATLANALRPCGLFSFTMVKDSPAANDHQFTGMLREELQPMLESYGLSIEAFNEKPVGYGKEQTQIDTYFIRTRRI